MRKTRTQVLLRSMRIPFLLLTPTSILLGLSTAVHEGNPIDWWLFTLILIAALSAHISVNTLNEYRDFQSGLDLLTHKTPFSGGSGALPEQPRYAGMVLLTGILSLLITISLGLYFIYLRGWLILPLGLLGIVIILSYSGWINRHPFLCLIAPGLAFGPIMVVGAHNVLSGYYSWYAGLVSLLPFLLVNNLLLLNQYPDIEADRQVGRRHIPIVYGTDISSRIYAASLLLAFLFIFLATTGRLLPLSALICLIMVLPAAYALKVVVRHAGNPQKLLPALKHNVLVTLLTPSLLALSLLFD